MALQKTNHKGLQQDKKTKALINTDMTGYDQIIAQRKADKKTRDMTYQIDNLNKMVSDLRDDLEILKKNCK
jgi:hypothetical protein